MSVEIEDMTFDKVASGPVSARVYQGAEFAALPTTRSLGFNVRITP